MSMRKMMMNKRKIRIVTRRKRNPKRKRRRRTRMKNQKILQIIHNRKVPKGRKDVGSEDTDDGQSKRKRIKLETEDGGKKSKEVVEDNEITNKKATPRKRKASKISEGVKSDPAKSNKGNSYPAKRT